MKGIETQPFTKASTRRPSSSFNPLHCGAVVASTSSTRRPLRRQVVSIPFIAGQWSLPPGRTAGARGGGVSIPFIAGQWSLPRAAAGGGGARWSVSIPFIAGQWSLRRLENQLEALARLVSIPFIAGQWSLPLLTYTKTSSCVGTFQSPSLRGSGRFLVYR